MSSIQIKQMKVRYQAYLHTDAGKKNLTVAMSMLKQWKKQAKTNPDCLKTICVKKTNLPEQIADKMQCLEIEPIGLNNLCHRNAELFTGFGYDSHLGYNVMSCPCGKNHCFELHTVSKARNTLVDFTRDYASETRKWFYPLNTSLDAGQFIQVFGESRTCIQTNSGCKCFSQSTEKGVKRMTMEEFQEFIKMVERMQVMQF